MKFLLVLLMIALLGATTMAQEEFDGRSFDGIKQDFKAVNAAAHVKIKNIQLSVRDMLSLYEVESEVIEVFKGKIDKSKPFKFYFSAEDGYDVKQLIGNEYVIFLNGKRLVPAGGKGYYELENSKLTASETLVGKLRQLKTVKKPVAKKKR